MNIFILLTIIAGFFMSCGTVFADNVPKDLESMPEIFTCNPRGGIGNVLAKLKKGGDVRIAYFGGSVTAQTGWRVQSREYLQKIYPQAKITEINAAIGGTGSTLAAFRMDNDVLKHKPDLVFVEFAGNDSNRSRKHIICGLEGIVRKIWKSNPSCDICFTYTSTNTNTVYPYLKRGKMFPSCKYFEEVAAYYNIPSIFMGSEVMKLERAGKLIFKAESGNLTRVSGAELDKNSPIQVNKDGKIPFAPDGVHPYNNTGHRLYTEAIIAALPKIKAAGKVAPHKLPKPIDPNNLESSCRLELDKSMMKGDWTKVEPKVMGRDFSRFFTSLWKATPGATLTFKFTGTKILFYDLVGPDGPLVHITLDGRDLGKRPRFDSFCSYHRPGPFAISLNMSPDYVHTIKLEVLGDDFDKKEIFAKYNRNDNIADMTKHPEKYKGKNWYVGAILINGKLVNDKETEKSQN